MSTATQEPVGLGLPPVPPGPTPEEIQVPVLETLDRVATGIITVVPPLLLLVGGRGSCGTASCTGATWRSSWSCTCPPGSASPSASTACSRTAASRPQPWMRGLLAVLGTMAVEGPVISWVADHRKHHAYSDRLGDPHSPHVDTTAAAGAERCAGSAHAHVGWLFDHTQRGARERFAPDLLADPVVVVRRSHVHRVVAARAGDPVRARRADRRPHRGRGLEAMLWGGAVRMLRAAPRHLQHQLALPLLRPPTVRHRAITRATCRGWRRSRFGEAWHNNHHAFPTSAFHGMGRARVRRLGSRDLRPGARGSGLGRAAHRARAQAAKAL